MFSDKIELTQPIVSKQYHNVKVMLRKYTFLNKSLKAT
jgi:hypothetical protein